MMAAQIPKLEGVDRDDDTPAAGTPDPKPGDDGPRKPEDFQKIKLDERIAEHGGEEMIYVDDPAGLQAFFNLGKKT